MSFSTGSRAAQDVIAFLHTMGRLKDTARRGWVEHDIRSPESISDHMYRMSLMCMMCPDTTLNRDRMIKMALCHDTGESIIGDISPAMKVPKEVKRKQETQAIQDLCGLLSSSPSTTFATELRELFEEYEAQETAESHFVKDMDLLEMIVQAHGYESANPGKDLSSFFRSGAGIRHPWARAIFETLANTRPYSTSKTAEVEEEGRGDAQAVPSATTTTTTASNM
ncbi:HD domain containing protein [Novymonas esmeraldas]|uniref:5'-deoxynucleotidase n=1 Tax=Novymonas esmeraldas TaxID=1808958 RepID=A0AAW0F3C6_9TRYP